MTNFEIIKERVSVPQAAEYYGIKSRNGKCNCFVHTDKTPSMKLYDKNYHCFGCGANGDVISLVAKLFDLSMGEAAKRINADFGLGLDMGKPPDRKDIERIECQKQEEQAYTKWENKAFEVLNEYHDLLLEWRKKAPATPEEVPDKLFVESLCSADYEEYIFYCFLNGSREERLQLKDVIDRFEKIVKEYRGDEEDKQAAAV